MIVAHNKGRMVVSSIMHSNVSFLLTDFISGYSAVHSGLDRRLQARRCNAALAGMPVVQPSFPASQKL
ncbi:hypothetical protein [Neoasaia chiangmaiensis]|uniref:hypothetical protein n=1 Tax=Neoasaia chiangmaiensis TaxID=320497 RepID=UPI00147942F6|nr:hypothetical protein [Neoasaia chiangmaiensis]